MRSQHIIFSLLILSIRFDELMAADSACGDWEPYKEEECFKIFDRAGLQSYEDAEKTCHQQDNSSSLISIRFQEEQEFISNLLFKTHKVVDNVWIGAKYTSNKFKWIDDSDLIYTNWVEGSPKNKSDHCVQMNSDETSFGKWSDVFCNKKNLVVCQKMQTLSLSQLQKILFDVKKNPVPIGFIYVQLPNEKSPIEIWPWMTWNDVSSAYAGVFFRVTGENSAAFGQIQNENSPKLIGLKYNEHQANLDTVSITPGYWSPWVRTTNMPNAFTGSCGLSFYVSPGEVRPRNMAIRIWKRTG